MSASNPTVVAVLSTLAGTALGLCAAIANSWFTHAKSIGKEVADRRRQRLEELYATLLDVRRYYQRMIEQALSKIHDKDFKDFLTKEPVERIPPIIKSEMLVSLYFPELKANLAGFNKARDAMGKEFADIIVGDFSALALKDKQAKCDRFLDLYNAIDVEIARFHARICEIIEP